MKSLPLQVKTFILAQLAVCVTAASRNILCQRFTGVQQILEAKALLRAHYRKRYPSVRTAT